MSRSNGMDTGASGSNGGHDEGASGTGTGVEHYKRGQAGNGIAKLVARDDGRGSVIVQAKRGHGLGGIDTDPWTVCIVTTADHAPLTPSRARELAAHLTQGAAEAEQFEREDAAERSLSLARSAPNQSDPEEGSHAA